MNGQHRIVLTHRAKLEIELTYNEVHEAVWVLSKILSGQGLHVRERFIPFHALDFVDADVELWKQARDKVELEQRNKGRATRIGKKRYYA